jgi:hypothetical protein
MRLIDDCRLWWRFWSTRIQLLAAALAGLLAFDPGMLVSAWNAMPDNVREMMPGRFVQMVGGLLFAFNLASILARQIKQKKLEEKRDATA